MQYKRHRVDSNILSSKSKRSFKQGSLEDRWFCKIPDVPCYKSLPKPNGTTARGDDKKVNDLVMKKLLSLKLTKGKKMRVDREWFFIKN